MPRRKPAPNQQELPLRIQLNKLMLKRLGLQPREKHLLHIFLSILGNTSARPIFLGEQGMADAMEVDARTARRAIKGLCDHELIFKKTWPRKGLRVAAWNVRVPTLWELAGVKLGDDSTGQDVRSFEQSAGQDVRSFEPATGQDVRSTELHKKIESSNPMGGTEKIHMNHGTDGALKEPGRKWQARQLTRADLRDTDMIAGLLQHAVAQGRWKSGEHGEHEFFTLCVYCERQGDDPTPGKLLTSAVFEGKQPKPSNADERRGAELLHQRKRSQPRSQLASNAASTVAASLAAPRSATPTPLNAGRSPEEVKAALLAMRSKRDDAGAN